MSSYLVFKGPQAPAVIAGFGQYDFVKDCGAVGDGATDNAAAMMAFNTAARVDSAAGRGVRLYVPPGVYNFNGANVQKWLYGIDNLHIVGPGAVFQNTYNRLLSGDNFGASVAWAAAVAPDFHTAGPKIATAARGATSVTLLTPADNTKFAVGDFAMVGSCDVQYYGYPVNLHFVEFKQITAINATTGEITFANQYLNYDHRADFPDFNSEWPGGAARLWPINGASADGCNWGRVRHVYEGLEIRLPPNPLMTYFSVSGRAVKFVDCVMPGLAPSTAGFVHVQGGRITAQCEPDKNVDHFLLEGVNLEGAIDFQSSSFRRVDFMGCKVRYAQIGNAKSFTAVGCEFEWLEFGAMPYGMADEATLIDCTIRNSTYGRQMTDGQAGVDGTDVAFANGVFSVTKASGKMIYLNCVPGQMIQLTGSLYTGDREFGFVTKLTEDATKFYIQTTLPYAALPSWATGHIYLRRHGKLTMRGCGGCDLARRYQDALEHGYQPNEYYREVYLGKAVSNAPYYGGRSGRLLQVNCNVLQASTVSGASTFDLFSYSSYDKDAFTNSGQVDFIFDLKTPGKRSWTPGATTKLGADDFKLAGVSGSTMPLRWFRDTFFTTFSNAPSGAADDHQQAIFEIEMIFEDRVISLRPPVFDDGSGNVVTGIIGTLT